MANSGAAAVHAFVLVIVHTKLLLGYILDNPQWVLLGCPSLNGTRPTPTSNLDKRETWHETGLWFPVVPLSLDDDSSGVLAIVGVAFLVIVLMQT